jgi:hypothetical protein
MSKTSLGNKILAQEGKIKVSFSLYLIKHHSMKTHGGVEVQLDTTWHMMLFYSLGKSLWYPLYSRLGGTHSQSRCFVENSFAPAGNLPLI